jgi:teichuronic acid biosynthesis glycosyltransferase TuaC
MVMNGALRDGVPQVVSFVQSQAEALQAAGWRVQLGVVDNRTSLYGILRNIKRLRSEILAARPVLVHAQYGSVTAAVANAGRGDLPLVISFCGDDILGTPGGLKWRLRSKMSRMISFQAAREASAIIVKSQNLFDALPLELSSKTTILPNGVDTVFFKPMDRVECRERLGWARESRIVLFNASHGSDTYRKNPELARAALGRVSSDVIMKIMGKNIKDEVRLMLNAADCLLVTSLHEGSPNIVKEAMACNLPVVSVSCGDVAERLRGVSSSAVCDYDADALADSISKVLDTPVRSNGREQLTLQGLTAPAVAAQLIKIYSSLIKE